MYNKNEMGLGYPQLLGGCIKGYDLTNCPATRFNFLSLKIIINIYQTPKANQLLIWQ